MHVRLIDANSLGYAQHHAQDIRTNGQIQTQAIAGVLNHARKSLQFDRKTLNVFIWDGRAQWRYDLYEQYKNGRHRTVEQRQARVHYEAQRPWIQKVLSYFPVVQLMPEGAEADDVAFGLSDQLAQQGHLVSMYTADTDWLASVRRRVSWVNARKPTEVVEWESFTRSTGYARPSQVAEVKALTGDASDDIEGLPDVGKKRAVALLAKYGTLEAVLAASEDLMAFSAEAKYFHSLMVPEYRQMVLRNRQLVDLAKGPRLTPESIGWVEGEYEQLEVEALFYDLHFRQWHDAFGQWHKALEEAALAKSDVLSLKRALSQIGSSWPDARASAGATAG